MTNPLEAGSAGVPVVESPPAPLELVEFSCMTGWCVSQQSSTVSGTVALRRRGATRIGQYAGVGEIDALFNATMNAARQHSLFPNGDTPELMDFGARALGQGSQASAEVKIVLLYKGDYIPVRLEDANTIKGCVFAFVAALNQLAAAPIPAAVSPSPLIWEGSD